MIRDALGFQDFKRGVGSLFWNAALSLIALSVLLFLFWILISGLMQFEGTDLPVFTPALKESLSGSFRLVLFSSMIAIPWGVAVGIYLSEYGRGLLASVLRFCVNLLSSTPSILMGVFAYALFIAPSRHFSFEAGVFALLLIQIPILAQSVEAILNAIPSQTREAGLSLGIPKWRVILQIALRAALPMILGSVFLSFGRVLGEGAPLLFVTGSGSAPLSLPVQVFARGVEAKSAVFFLCGLVFVFNLVARVLLLRARNRKGPQA